MDLAHIIELNGHRCFAGALDVDELIEALETLGARPKKSKLTQLVQALNNGEKEMDLAVFEMLVTQTTDLQNNDLANVLTHGMV